MGETSTIRIVVASDMHLGFMEQDEERGGDSFEAFEEVLRAARAHDADMLLLGGDLFHDHKPSRGCLHRAITLLRTYCLGDRPVALRVVSAAGAPAPSASASSSSDGTATTIQHTCAPPRPNWEDPNFNVALPVFCVHGNHDDPGRGGLAALDLLAAANLVNYIGKTASADDVAVSPVLITKGSTRLALYGLGNIRDERLYRSFEQKKVRMLRPPQQQQQDPSSEQQSPWFNLMVVHQNRSAHGPKAFLSEEMIEGFVDFVLWGHEHECLISAQSSSSGKFFISQPGSTVAVALTEGEAKPKHFGILEINGEKFRLRPQPLRTVRPFLIESIVLSEVLEAGDSEAVQAVLEERVNSMISKATEDAAAAAAPLHLPGHDAKRKLPLIRLHVDHTGFPAIPLQRFGQKFVGKVANPADILLFARQKTTKRRERVEPARIKGTRSASGAACGGDGLCGDRGSAVNLDELISRQLLDAGELQLIPARDLLLALSSFVSNKDKDAIGKAVRQSVESMQSALRGDSEATDKASILASIAAISAAAAAAKRDAVSRAPDSAAAAAAASADSVVAAMDDVDEGEDQAPRDPDALLLDIMRTTPKQDAQQKRGRRKAAAADEDDEDEDEDEEKPRKAARKPRAKKGAAAAAADDDEGLGAPATKRSRKPAAAAASGESGTSQQQSLRSGRQLASKARAKPALPLVAASSSSGPGPAAQDPPAGRLAMLFGKWSKQQH